MSYIQNTQLISVSSMKELMSHSLFYKDDKNFESEVLDGFLSDLLNEVEERIVSDDEIDIDFADVRDGYYLNAEMVPSVDNSLLYCTQVPVETETLIRAKVDFRSCDVSPVSHVSGLRITYLAEQLQDIYLDMVCDREMEIYDLTAENISKELGGIKYFDFFKEPYSGFTRESNVSFSSKKNS